MVDYRDELVALAEAYCAHTKRSEARMANLAGRDGQFFNRLRAGKGCNVDTHLKMRRWFADNWPADLAWPDGVDRPNVLPTSPNTPEAGRAA